MLFVCLFVYSLAFRNGSLQIVFVSNVEHGSVSNDNVIVADAVVSFAVIICWDHNFPCAIFELRGARCTLPSRFYLSIR